MDNNMLKAHRELELAKERITAGDYVAARKKLLEIQRHNPDFNNIAGMVTVCDILHSAAAGYEFLGCGTDYYWVLEVSPGASEVVIQNQYDKFAKLLKPIKKNFPGAASALTIIQDALAVLSDPEKHSVFDITREKIFQRFASGRLLEACAVYSQQGCPLTLEKEETLLDPEKFARKDLDGTYGICSAKDVVVKSVTNAEISNSPQVMEIEDVEMSAKIVAHRVADECRHIKAGGISKNLQSEISAIAGKPTSNTSSSMDKTLMSMTSVAGKKCFPNFYKFDDMRKAEAFAVGQVWAVYDQEDMPRNYAQIVNIKIHPLPSRMFVKWLEPVPVTMLEKKWCQVQLPAVCGQFNVDQNLSIVLGPTSFSHMVSLQSSKRIEIYPREGEIWAIYKDWKPAEWCSDPKARRGYKLQPVEIVRGYSNQEDMLVIGLVKVEGFRSVYRRRIDNGSECLFQIPARNKFMFSHGVPAHKFTGGEMDGITEGMFELDPLALSDVVVSFVAKEISCNSAYTLNYSITTSDAETEQRKIEMSAKKFMPDQVWAVYDGPDSMPRQYVVVNNVVSGTEICVTFLEPQPMLADEACWLKENLPICCGLFKVGKTNLNLKQSKFAHMVKCEKCTDTSLYKIFPKKGQIWAMYSGWKKADFINYHCKIVEIIADFSEEVSGLIALVANLEEVPGCRTFFRRQLVDGFELVRAIPRTETLSFSHQIAAFSVPGAKAHNIPEDCWHLEPNALPPNSVLHATLNPQSKFL